MDQSKEAILMERVNPHDLNDEIKTDRKETNQLLHHKLSKVGPRGSKYITSRSTSSLVRCTSSMRTRPITHTDLDASTSASSKLRRRLNIFCTIRHRRVPRAIRHISATFRNQLNVLRPSSAADSDELAAARDCLLDLDDYLETIGKEFGSADEEDPPQNVALPPEPSGDDNNGRNMVHIQSAGIDEAYAPRTLLVRRNSFREAISNSMTTTTERSEFFNFV